MRPIHIITLLLFFAALRYPLVENNPSSSSLISSDCLAPYLQANRHSRLLDSVLEDLALWYAEISTNGADLFDPQSAFPRIRNSLGKKLAALATIEPQMAGAFNELISLNEILYDNLAWGFGDYFYQELALIEKYFGELNEKYLIPAGYFVYFDVQSTHPTFLAVLYALKAARLPYPALPFAPGLCPVKSVNAFEIETLGTSNQGPLPSFFDRGKNAIYISKSETRQYADLISRSHVVPHGEKDFRGYKTVLNRLAEKYAAKINPRLPETELRDLVEYSSILHEARHLNDNAMGLVPQGEEMLTEYEMRGELAEIGYSSPALTYWNLMECLRKAVFEHKSAERNNYFYSYGAIQILNGLAVHFAVPDYVPIMREDGPETVLNKGTQLVEELMEYPAEKIRTAAQTLLNNSYSQTEILRAA